MGYFGGFVSIVEAIVVLVMLGYKNMVMEVGYYVFGFYSIMFLDCFLEVMGINNV